VESSSVSCRGGVPGVVGTDVPALRGNPILGILGLAIATLLNAVNFLDNMDGILGSIIPVTAGDSRRWPHHGAPCTWRSRGG